MTRHTLSVLVENKPGVLARIAGLFSRRGFNIDSLAVGPTENPEVSRMTIVISVDRLPLEQVTKQLNKLVDVVKLADLTEGPHLERELMLLKARAVDAERDELKRLADIFRGRIVDVTDATYTIELTGSSDKLDAFIAAVGAKHIVEVVRSGVSGIARGERCLRA